MSRAAFVALGACLVFWSPAIAQQTNCITTGYGPQQHVWCNTTPPPAQSTQLQDSMANFGAALGNAMAEAAEQRRQAQAESQAQASYQAQIDAFAADPAHPYFQQERQRMAAIVQAGRTMNLQVAYDLALAEDPAVQAAMQQANAQPR